MRLTERCTDLLKLLRAARWLTTAQIQRRFFSTATADAVRKRLRKLNVAGYVVAVRQDRMSQSMFRLGPQGRRLLETFVNEPIAFERKPPIQRLHFEAINDFRIAAELAGHLKFFYAA
jgi:DNA-binding PadR family transcriptional regulator